MNAYDELKDNIENSIRFYGKSATGFNPCDCPSCGGVKKAGFIIESDEIVFNCFKGKCSIGSTAYKRDGYMSNKFKSLMNAANVDMPIKVLMDRNKFVPEDFLDISIFEPHKYVPFSFNFAVEPYNPDEPNHEKFKRYIDSRRISYNNFYIFDHGAYFNKLIVPFFYNTMLVGFQALDITGKTNPVKKGNPNLIFLPNGVMPAEPIVVEGVFDALSVPDGVAILQSTITKKQAYLFRNKKPILLPDRSGSRFMSDARIYGWRVSIPKWQSKDANKELQDFGKFVTAKKVYDGIISSTTQAELEYSLWNTNKNKRGK